MYVKVSKSKFNLVKGSKCHACMQSKQPHKSYRATEARNLETLELVHTDLCEMNGILTKGGERYFMTFIGDCSQYYHVYLLKTKCCIILRSIKLK